MIDLRVWPALILAGALVQALSFVPLLRRLRLRSALIALGGALVLYAAATERDHQILIGQLVVWVWLWRGVVRANKIHE